MEWLVWLRPDAPPRKPSRRPTFAQVVQAKAQQDPEGYAKVMQELQPELLQIQQKQDVDALCAFYDKAIAKLK
mgnify:CR=1 FL=1